MKEPLINLDSLRKIAQLTAVESVEFLDSIQTLWSGYGEILRVRLWSGSDQSKTAIVKLVNPPTQRDHKYGWSNDVSHQRKLQSYDNELNWYLGLGNRCEAACRIPRLIAGTKTEQQWIVVLEDLDAAGFDLRRSTVDEAQVNSCLDWLANMHAEFMRDTDDRESAEDQTSVWPTGTYWHLATRPDEFATMKDSDLKRAATKLDSKLSSTRFQTIVHGDAKLANFCFSENDRVAAVDFQYVGGGCGMKDVAYFISSCFGDNECERREKELLDRYFQCLETALSNRNRFVGQFQEIQTQWRQLYPIAWADFYRFLAGWSPGHWKMHGYSERITRRVISELDES